MPLVAARWFWSTGDFLVGVLLICQAAVVIVGLNYRSEEHTSELQSLMRISYAVFCLKKKTTVTLKRTRIAEARYKKRMRLNKRQYSAKTMTAHAKKRDKH